MVSYQLNWNYRVKQLLVEKGKRYLCSVKIFTFLSCIPTFCLVYKGLFCLHGAKKNQSNHKESARRIPHVSIQEFDSQKFIIFLFLGNLTILIWSTNLKMQICFLVGKMWGNNVAYFTLHMLVYCVHFLIQSFSFLLWSLPLFKESLIS